jgi:hypothetical protein
MDETTQFTAQLQMLWWETILPQQQNNNMSQCDVPTLHIFCIEMDKTPLFTSDMCHEPRPSATAVG